MPLKCSNNAQCFGLTKMLEKMLAIMYKSLFERVSQTFYARSRLRCSLVDLLLVKTSHVSPHTPTRVVIAAFIINPSAEQF